MIILKRIGNNHFIIAEKDGDGFAIYNRVKNIFGNTWENKRIDDRIFSKKSILQVKKILSANI